MIVEEINGHRLDARPACFGPSRHRRPCTRVGEEAQMRARAKMVLTLSDDMD